MNIRNIILKAANSIEANPHLFDFESVNYPNPGCNTPGCALGWIAAHAHINAQYSQLRGCGSGAGARVLGVDSLIFYNRMRRLSSLFRCWKKDAKTCAKTLRKYADRYHPAKPKPRQGIPDNVMSIFEPEPSHDNGKVPSP